MESMNQYKAAILGCGGISPMHARSLTSIGVRLAAVCDIVPERAAAFAQEYNCEAFTDYHDMLKGCDFDVLHICLPHYLHAPAAIEALQNKKHVLTEKPMATSVADAEQMITTAAVNNVKLGVIFQNRYNPGSVLVKKALDSGALGKIRGGWLRVNWFRDDAYYVNSDWRGRWSTEGGGVVINQSIHTFDLLRYFCGTPVYVEATAVNRAHPSIEVEDMAEGVIAFDGGVHVSFYVNTYHPYDAPAALELVCEKGTASISGDQAVIHYKDGQTETADYNTDADVLPGMKDYWGVSHIRQIRAFYQSLASGGEPDINGEEGLKTQKLVNAIYESSRVGKRVYI